MRTMVNKTHILIGQCHLSCPECYDTVMSTIMMGVCTIRGGIVVILLVVPRTVQ